MSFPYDAATLAAISRLLTLYNGSAFNASTNPGGMANGGHRTNFIPALQDLATTSNSVSDAASAASTSASEASASADTASALITGLNGTSSTSLSIGTGSQSLTTQTDKSFDTGTFVGLFSDASPTTHYMVGQVTAYDADTGALTANITASSGSGTRADWTIYGRMGATGLTGATGATGSQGETPAPKWTFSSTTTDSDPGNGVLRLNNATISSVTQLYFDNIDAAGATQTTFLDSFDDSTTQSVKGTIVLQKVGTTATFAIFNVSGSPNVVVDGTGYRKVTVSYVSSNGTFSLGDTIAVMFYRTGDAGSDGAGAGDTISDISSVTSGRVVVYNGTTGKHVTDGGKGIGTSGSNLGALDTANTYSATQSFATRVDAQQDFMLSGIITPTALAADTHNYAPTGHATATVFRLSATGSQRLLTGLQGGVAGRVVTFINVGAINIVLNHENTDSTAANRFLTGTQVILSTNKSITFIYDGTSARWRCINPIGDVQTVNNLTDLQNPAQAYDIVSRHGSDVASAATTNLETFSGNLIDITGTTTINAFTLSDGHERTVRFTGILTLTHSSSLILPRNGQNITTAAGDFAILRGYSGGVVRCVGYFPISGAAPGAANQQPTGRLTLTSGTAITESDVSGVTTVYFTPVGGNVVPIYDGSMFIPTFFGELSNISTDSSTGKAGPAAVTASKNYFLMVWNDSGTIRLTRSPAWSSDTVVGTGAGTAEIEMVNGVWVNKQDITNGPTARKGTIVGGVRSNASSLWADTLYERYVSNIYNVAERPLYSTNTGSAYVYNLNTFRQANNDPVNEVRWFSALGGVATNIEVTNVAVVDTINNYIVAAVGVDSTSAAVANQVSPILQYGAAINQSAHARWRGFAGQGYHRAVRLEWSASLGNTTWHTNSTVSPSTLGITGFTWN